MVRSIFEEISSTESDMADYWLSYMEMVEVLLLSYHSLRAQLWEDYLHSMRLVMPWMHMYDNVNYARYLPVCWSMLKSLDEDIAAHTKAGYFSFSLTCKLFSSLPPDQTIEIKMNRSSKIKEGWTKFT